MSGIIGKYIGMTSIFDENGINIPCSIIEAGPCPVIQIKTIEIDGYSSVQLGFDNKKNINNPLKGHFNKANVLPKKKLIEFKGEFIKNLKIGDLVTVDIFNEGEYVDVTALSKGKGFQGVVKRHGFSGVGQRTHGQHNRLRAPGSIGAGSDPSRVFKGTRMAGKMGNNNVTIKNLKVLKINIEKNFLIIKGSIPGSEKTYLTIKRWK